MIHRMDEATRKRISRMAKAEFGPTCEVQFEEEGGRERLMILLEGDVISRRQLFQFADFGKQTDEALRRVIRNMCPLPLGA
jgi:hypothetical protein